MQKAKQKTWESVRKFGELRLIIGPLEFEQKCE